MYEEKYILLIKWPIITNYTSHTVRYHFRTIHNTDFFKLVKMVLKIFHGFENIDANGHTTPKS